MKQLANCLSLVILGSVAIAAGCSSSNPQTGDGGGMGGAGGSVGPLQALTPDMTGYVDVGATGTTGIKGAWYAYGDGIGSDGTTGSSDCVLKGGHMTSECSTITMPVFGSFMNTNGKMCTSGTVAKVINMGAAADYTNIWGAGIGFDFNNAGTADGGPGKLPFNATAAGVVGVQFDIDMVPLATLRVEFPNMTNKNAPFWGGAVQMASPIKLGTNTILWKDVQGPFYDPAPTPFDPTTLLSIQFHVPTTTGSSAQYMFCVSNLSAILAH
jgi:hypothetical protein